MICIYAIINIVTDSFYIGQTKDRDFRWSEHRKQLRGFYHHSLYLQRAWCKYGEDKFIFVVLEVLTDIHKLNEREAYWFQAINPEYNVAPAGTMRGYKHSEQAKKNMSEAHKGKCYLSEEEKQKRSERMKGNTFAAGRKHTLERIEARAKLHRGVKRSEETKLKMSEAKRGRRFTDEHKAKLKAAAKNRQPVSEETRKKLSQAALRQWNNA